MTLTIISQIQAVFHADFGLFLRRSLILSRLLGYIGQSSQVEGRYGSQNIYDIERERDMERAAHVHSVPGVLTRALC